MKQEGFRRLTKYITGEIPPHFRLDPGVEAYDYYIKLSKKAKKGTIISDLGTYQGLSALALSSNPLVKVKSYDIDLSHNLVSGKANIQFIEGNIFDHIDDILKSDIILVDIDPHDGIQEEKFYEILVERGYKGLTIWDDIYKDFMMETFWHRVNMQKQDITNIGHHSGTGLIEFKHIIPTIYETGVYEQIHGRG